MTALTLGILSANAWGDEGVEISLKGFGTLGLAWSSIDEATFVRDVSQPSGPRGGFDTSTDSRLGMQLDAHLYDHLSVTVQGISRYRYDGSFSPQLTWGFLKYSPGASIDFRLGRLGWDVYMLADSRDVGYSYLWVRPPVEYYGPLQFSKLNGADVVFTQPLGEGLAWVKLFGGEAHDKFAHSKDSYLDVEGSRLIGGHLNYQHRKWQYRLGYTRLELEMDLGGDLAQFNRLIEHFNSSILRQAYDRFLKHNTYEFLSAGLAWDGDRLKSQFMYSYLKNTGGTFPEFQSGYFSIGYRVGSWTPYFMYSMSSVARKADFLDGFSLPALPLLQRLPELMESASPSQHTFSLGTRLDLRRDMALKLQVDHIHARQFMLWRNVEPHWDGHATIFSATVDFVF